MVKQFEMTGKYGPFADPDISTLFKEDSSVLTVAKVKPFVMIMSDIDQSPNILNIEAKFEKSNTAGLINILSAIRDNTINNMGFLFAPTTFNPDHVPLPLPADNNFEGVPFVQFMKTFWGRQAYPAGNGDGPPLPSVPELYDPEADPAINVEFKGFSQNGPAGDRALTMSFLIKANTHYVISQYKLPLLMLSGQLPPVAFGFHVKVNSEPQLAARLFVTPHRKENDKEIVFDLKVEVVDVVLYPNLP